MKPANGLFDHVKQIKIKDILNNIKPMRTDFLPLEV